MNRRSRRSPPGSARRRTRRRRGGARRAPRTSSTGSGLLMKAKYLDAAIQSSSLELLEAVLVVLLRRDRVVDLAGPACRRRRPRPAPSATTSGATVRVSSGNQSSRRSLSSSPGVDVKQRGFDPRSPRRVASILPRHVEPTTRFRRGAAWPQRSPARGASQIGPQVAHRATPRHRRPRPSWSDRSARAITASAATSDDGRRRARGRRQALRDPARAVRRPAVGRRSTTRSCTRAASTPRPASTSTSRPASTRSTRARQGRRRLSVGASISELGGGQGATSWYEHVRLQLRRPGRVLVDELEGEGAGRASSRASTIPAARPR